MKPFSTDMAFAPDLALFLQPLDSQEPTGSSLRYAPVYAQIREARTEEDANLPMGEWSRPLKKADWRTVESLCTDVLQNRSKDLQVAVWLTEAWVHLHGIGGLIAGAQLVHGLSTQFWDTVHPVMEDGDAEVRAAPLSWSNATLAQTLLLQVPLLPYPDHVPPFVFLNDWLRALSSEYGSGPNRNKDEESDELTRQDILALAESNLHSLAALDDQAAQAHQAWDALNHFLNDRMGNDAPSVAKIIQTISQVQQALRSMLQHRDPRQQASESAPEDALSETPDDVSLQTQSPEETPMTEALMDPATASQPNATTTAPLGAIQSREDAYRLLERAAAYLEKTEPHSPTPYLIKRAVTWGRLPLHELMLEIMREEGDLNRYFSLLGVRME